MKFNQRNLKVIADIHDEAGSFIQAIWKRELKWGYGYFDRWEYTSSGIRVHAVTPRVNDPYHVDFTWEELQKYFEEQT